jgi:hypothetical protein
MNTNRDFDAMDMPAFWGPKLPVDRYMILVDGCLGGMLLDARSDADLDALRGRGIALKARYAELGFPSHEIKIVRTDADEHRAFGDVEVI